MKKSRNGNLKLRRTVAISLPLCIIIMSTFFAKPISERYGNIALALAGSSMPEGSINMIKSGITGESKTCVEPVINQTGTKQEEVTQGEKVTPPIAQETPYNESHTPDDIITIMEQAKLNQANAKNSGSIAEKTYGKGNSTSIYKNVCVRNVTDTKTVNIQKTLENKADLNIIDKSQPTVLIFHTHTTEAYEVLDRGWYSTDFPTRSKNSNTSVVRVGVAIQQRLEAAGFVVLHDTQIHDLSYNGSYAHSRISVDNYKSKYPSLKVIIDVHRDGIQQSDGTKIKPVTSINGKKASQIMIITGCQDGKVTEFPDWQQNLVFALQLQKKAEDLYPGLMRPVFFAPRKYNMDTSHCGVLLEVGSDANTLEEAVYSGGLIGNSLAALMNDYVSK